LRFRGFGVIKTGTAKANHSAAWLGSPGEYYVQPSFKTGHMIPNILIMTFYPVSTKGDCGGDFATGLRSLSNFDQIQCFIAMAYGQQFLC